MLFVRTCGAGPTSYPCLTTNGGGPGGTSSEGPVNPFFFSIQPGQAFLTKSIPRLPVAVETK